MELHQQHCIPCEGGVPPLHADAVKGMLARLKHPWQTDNNRIWAEFAFNNFQESMKFVNKVAAIAEHEGHHPDIYIFYNKVKLELSTHAIKGLSENDFILAAKIDKAAGVF